MESDASLRRITCELLCPKYSRVYSKPWVRRQRVT
jgi:hypothetical protein